jgi:hypothetical protein
MHYTPFGLQQTMKQLQTNALSTAAHCLVQVGESSRTTKSANDVAECPLSHSIFDCRVFSYNVREDGADANHGHNFLNEVFLPFSIFCLEPILGVWRRNHVWMVVEGIYQQQFQLVADCGVSLTFRCKRPVNPNLFGTKQSAFLNQLFVNTSKGGSWNTKSISMITPAWIACLPHR